MIVILIEAVKLLLEFLDSYLVDDSKSGGPQFESRNTPSDKCLLSQLNTVLNPRVFQDNDHPYAPHWDYGLLSKGDTDLIVYTISS